MTCLNACSWMPQIFKGVGVVVLSVQNQIITVYAMIVMHTTYQKSKPCVFLCGLFKLNPGHIDSSDSFSYCKSATFL